MRNSNKNLGQKIVRLFEEEDIKCEKLISEKKLRLITSIMNDTAAITMVLDHGKVCKVRILVKSGKARISWSYQEDLIMLNTRTVSLNDNKFDLSNISWTLRDNILSIKIVKSRISANFANNRI